MADICMCENDDCPSAKKCYRHEAKPSTRQTYTTFEVPGGKDRCGHFSPIWPTTNSKPAREAGKERGE